MSSFQQFPCLSITPWPWSAIGGPQLPRNLWTKKQPVDAAIASPPSVKQALLVAMNFFRSRPDASWVSAGPASSFPNLGEDAGNLVRPRLCDAHLAPGCKVFHVPKEQPSQASEIHIAPESSQSVAGDDLKDQVLVFQYRGKFHAVDHRCPHQSYSLSNGIPFDIEDFGIVLSAGLTCPKHGWSFDLFSGMSDRAAYKLPVWEVQLRDKDGVKVLGRKGDEADDQDSTIWVRRKQRIG
ncbi:hypothetical protein ED733_001367 [Metarhizium rileyi]|uniref:Rieske domain-containing protein n=1 Tax=Metarhizium rileyi (strain RCEF 4871) TaxID=1649241 RepID=A0A5C6GBQ9_METRR|nr:hypothetical protein ED733_001367 [Metarhizium rileyi]